MAAYQLGAKARGDFADMVESLSPDQLEIETLCEGWTAKHVLAHLVSFVELSGPAFFGNLVKSGFDFDRFTAAMVGKRIDRSVADLAGTLRAKGSKGSPLPMFAEALTVADVAVHTQDVRRPTGAAGSLDETVLRATLDFLTTHRQAKVLGERRPLAGVKLVANDLDWSFGDGPEITGTGEAIMMGIAKRPVLDDLSGDGRSAWR